MGAYYDEIEIEDMAWDAEKRVYHYPCPCGDRFEISKQQLRDYEDIATCPSCSLIIRVIYDPVSVCPEQRPGSACYLVIVHLHIHSSSILRMKTRTNKTRRRSKRPSRKAVTRISRML